MRSNPEDLLGSVYRWCLDLDTTVTGVSVVPLLERSLANELPRPISAEPYTIFPFLSASILLVVLLDAAFALLIASRSMRLLGAPWSWWVIDLIKPSTGSQPSGKVTSIWPIGVVLAFAYSASAASWASACPSLQRRRVLERWTEYGSRQDGQSLAW